MSFLKKKNTLIVGRASVGIYLILRERFEAGEVILPANICYAAVYPVLYAGMIPVFCDVDENSGNVSLKHISPLVSSKTKAMIIPHMYGNPIEDIAHIQEYCKNKKILLIEDCASAMGAGNDNKIVGGYGDYVLFSTGYSKIVDLGYGGIVNTDFSINGLQVLEEQLPEIKKTWRNDVRKFSSEYRRWRNACVDNNSRVLPQYFIDNNSFQSLFLFRCPEIYKSGLVDSIFRCLDEKVRIHKENWELYHSLLKSIREYSYDFLSGAVPWRYSFFVHEKNRKAIIQNMLQEGLPVSDWYPRVTPLFRCGGDFPGADLMERQILNFPLTISSDDILCICKCILKILRNNG